MKTINPMIVATAVAIATAPAAAQSVEEQAERNAAASEVELQEAERKMAEAERQLEEAARRIAELSTERLPRIIEREQMVIDLSDRPRLGVTISGDGKDGPVEGVSVIGVTPGSAAEDAGLRAGDVLTAVNDESLSASDSRAANEKLLDFMRGVEEGDKLDVEYLRNGNVGSVEVEPRIVERQAFVWAPRAPGAPVAPEIHREFNFLPMLARNAWRDMELVELNEGLGRYFGTDQGLLVVSAPASEALKLEDGDVIESIDGRNPTSVGHALRILASYQAGEELELAILRDKKRQTLKIEMPDDRRGFLLEFAPAAPMPVSAPRPAEAPHPEHRT